MSFIKDTRSGTIVPLGEMGGLMWRWQTLGLERCIICGLS